MPATTDDLVDRLLRLWTDPLPADPVEAADAFRTLYADPCALNGTPLTADDFVARARALQATVADVSREVLHVVATPEEVAVAFRITGRHVGPYASTLGTVPPTGGLLDMRVIDILTLEDGRITEITMVADEVGLLAGLGAVALVPPVGARP